MLLSPRQIEIHIYKEESLTFVHSWNISQDVGNCHSSLRAVLCECQSLTSALTSVRGPLWSRVLSSQSLCAVTGRCICDSDKHGVSGVGFCWAEPHWPEGPATATGLLWSASHREIRLTHPPAFSYSACQNLVCPLWTQRLSRSSHVYKARSDIGSKI